MYLRGWVDEDQDISGDKKGTLLSLFPSSQAAESEEYLEEGV
jgi:hypothetical protein